ncbi:PAS domain-containing protein [Halomicroarcula sp. S1AR25-4]|uniref:receiver/sensor box histidine kinase n=1 Tax=Haloarcula sp. S1AR25-4 TaxID=2950538 RepID=UPI0028746494|nr:ATP-binding protein [Halomicroarcula sp. S1AR25-4]MDS0276841.1 PAS domain-containing protein [Halomicroarcula sp. S1AR25-4]
MGHDENAATSHVLYLGAVESRTNTVERELESRADVTVYATTSTEDALERLAWPDIDCLVVAHRTDQFDGIEAAERVCETHPCLPVILFASPDSESAATRAVGTAVDEFVVHEGPEAFDTLATVISDLSFDDDIGDVHTADPEGPFVANVDAATVDRLLRDGIDRARLEELLHKSRLFDSIFDSIPVHLYVKDEQARHRYVSAGYFGDTLDEFLGKTDPEIGMVANRHARRAYVEDMHVIEEDESVIDKVEYLPMLDQWNLTSKVPWRGPDGDVVGLIGVTRDISERKARQEQVRRQNERLHRFANMVSHDLRNPLQLALLRLELARDADDFEAVAENLDSIERALERIDELIDDVLTLARQGTQVVTKSPVDLDDVVNVTWSSVDAPDATVERDGALGTILGDESRLRQLMANVFRNAIEHGGASVTVRVGPLTSATGFYVEDDGPGFPDAGGDDLFDAGYTTSSDGTGFGLSIVREIAAAHDWMVSATNGTDGGARIEFTGVERPDS